MIIFANRIAPIQVNYLGYAGTSGADYFDYIICDSITIPQSDATFFTEKLALLPNSFFPADSLIREFGPIPSRVTHGLPPNAFIFSCFNNAYKLNPTILDVWMRLLLKIPHSVLWLSSLNGLAKDNLLKEVKDTELTVPLEDIYFLGSTAGYNWTPTSDIDLHLVVDFDKIGDDEELVKQYVDGLKSKWNQAHDIKIGNHPVEVYIQDKKEVNKSQSVYSLMKNDWVKKPKHEDIKVDKDAIKKKYKQFVESINAAIQEQDIDKIKKLIKRIYDMRQAGLDKSGEYSTENLVFKLLRSTGYINKLRDTVTQLTDKELSKI